jgi:predicted phosphate transport protein (TIGR00153 family)
MRLLPRQEKFFVFFQSQSRIIEEASQLLLDGVRAGNGALNASVPQIAKLEQQGDEIIHEVFTKLNQTFITPIDPEDIHVLASDLDDVLDCIEDAAHRITAYRVDPIPPAVIELSEIIHACAKTLTKAFEALEKNDHVLEHCIEINRLEESADNVYRRSVADLFLNERDPIHLMKVKEVYEILEDTADRCEDIADALQNVVVKNS